MGVSLLILFVTIQLELGYWTIIISHVTFCFPFVMVAVQARLAGLDPALEEAAMDLGATPNRALRRVLLPLLWPAILASAALVFADSVDNFVTVRYLSAQAPTEPLSVKIYSAARASPTPAVNAAATVMLIATLTVIALAFISYRRIGGRRGDDVSATAMAEL
jgi:spermidine/putrescine transport system permease protein